MKKKLIKISLILLSLLIFISAAIAIYYYSYRVDYNADITAGVNSDIKINRDKQGIPEIEVNSMEGIFFALGYIHAQDRLNLMEYFRSIAVAQSSMSNGNSFDALDNLVKTVGITKKAWEINEKIKSPHREYLQSYADGINLIKKKKSEAKYLKRDWNTNDIISILLLREWANSYLSNMENIFRFTYEKKSYLLNTIIPDKLIHYYNQQEAHNIDVITKIKDILEKYVGTYNKGFSFYIGSGSTNKRKHVTGYSFSSGLNIYPSIYPVHIKFGDIHLKGITVCGLPFIYSGDNQNISFFGFSLDTDVQTFLVDDVKSIDGTPHFLSRTGWKKFNSVRVPVTDSNNEIKQEIIWATDNGPVLNDIFKNEARFDNIVSLNSYFPDTDYIVSLFNIPFSENIDKAVNAVKNINSLPRVYLFAHSSGSVKVFSGKVPVDLRTDRVFINGTYFKQRIKDISVFTEKNNSKQVAGSWTLNNAPAIVKNNSIYDSFRTDRLGDLLKSEKKHSLEDIKKILMDSYSKPAEKLVPVFLRILAANPVTSSRLSRIYFNEWSMEMDENMVAPSIFNILLKNFIIETYRDDFKQIVSDEKSVNLIFKNSGLLIDKFTRTLLGITSTVFDNRDTENVETLEMTFDKAFLKSMRFLNRRSGPIMDDWKWGGIHRGNYRNPLSDKAAIASMIYNPEDRGFGGGLSTVYTGKFDNMFTPERDSSVLGFFMPGESKVKINFTYSTDLMSEFNYAKVPAKEFLNFENVNTIYKTSVKKSK